MASAIWRSALLLALLAPTAAAQTVSGDRFTLNTGPCTMRSGLGPPAAALGKTCDTYLDTGSGDFWMKLTVGWTRPGGVTGSGTPHRLTKWTAATNIGDARLRESGTDLIADPLGNFSLLPTGDIYLGPAGRDVFPGTPYSVNLGALPNKYLTLHAAELWVETLVAQATQATIGGRLLIGPTTTLTRDLSATTPNPTTIYVKHNAFNPGTPGAAYGSTLQLESNGKVEFLLVDQNGFQGVTAQGDYAYLVYRDRDGSGTNDWYAGDAVFDQGVLGSGWLDLYSVRGVDARGFGPAIVGNVRTGAATNLVYNTWEPRFALGNLNGLYGYAGNTYGAAFGVPGGARITIEPSGVRLYDGSNTVRVNLGGDGTATFIGDGNGVTNINGGNIQTGTVSANKITAGSTRNVIRNSEARVSTVGWTPDGSYTGAVALNFMQSVDPWRLNAEPGTFMLHYTGITPAGQSLVATSLGEPFPVAPGTYIEASAYVGLHRISEAIMFLRFHAADGTFVAYDEGRSKKRCTPAEGGGGPSLSSYCRVWAVSNPVPGGAAVAYVHLLAATNGDATNPPYMFFTRVLLGEAKPTQTEPSEWAPAGVTEITGDMMRTGTIDARTIAANTITGAKIAGGTITGGNIAGGTITGGLIAGSTITGGNIAGGTITGGLIAGDTITGANIVGSTLSAITSDLGTVNAGAISGSLSINLNGAFYVDATGYMRSAHVRAESTGYSLTGAGNAQFTGLGGGAGVHVCADAYGYFYKC